MSNSHALSAQHIVQQLIPNQAPTKTLGFGEAPVNIALSKYWGKRQLSLNLPTNSSLSISLPGLGTQTHLSLLENNQNTEDQAWLNGQRLAQDSEFARRLTRYLDFFRPTNQVFKIDTINSVPTAAGLASSASGYAALVKALNDLFDWRLDLRSLSILARLGSGSASRSLFDGFAIWHKGQAQDGMDSFAEALPQTWKGFCIGLVKIDTTEKPIGSTLGMQQTVNTCELYQAWPAQAERQVKLIQQAIQQQNFSLLGETAEHNALSMHATMIATWPPILYWQAESVLAMQKVWQLRQQGVEVYFTMDAGPNLKLLFLEPNKNAVKAAFQELDVIQPFG
ncbi:MAG: diphosphomevalonate decarboxylase [Thiomicrospira sp.]|uniref:diphosphomevalonate decarboxylase n=1 Tax=Thiomicrospira sp. TaxID=935 RepID=UPI001A0FB616|nr:diphosphomevalonate decarboxylase [Thiomicrospira sp.]MBE0494430.1 diphosphomevalonate decarboxylase [Thiomicrospira sp.]